MIVTHFSRGSFLSIHGRSTSPFRTLREWKYRWFRVCWCKADEEAFVDAGPEVKGDAKGLARGTGVIESAKGDDSGVPGRMGVAVAVVVAV